MVETKQPSDMVLNVFRRNTSDNYIWGRVKGDKFSTFHSIWYRYQQTVTKAATLSTWGYLTEPAQTTGHRCDLCNLPASDWRCWVCSLLDSEIRALCSHLLLCLHSGTLPRQALFPLHSLWALTVSVPTSAQTRNAHPHLLLFITCFLPSLQRVTYCLLSSSRQSSSLAHGANFSVVREPTHNFSSEVWTALKFPLPKYSLSILGCYIEFPSILWLPFYYSELLVIPISYEDKDYNRIGTGRGLKRRIPKHGTWRSNWSCSWTGVQFWALCQCSGITDQQAITCAWLW